MTAPSSLEIENITLTVKLCMATDALRYICAILSDIPTAAEFVSEGLPILAQSQIDQIHESLASNHEDREELIEFVQDLYIKIHDDLGFPVED